MPQRDTPQSAVQSHYNKQANLNKNQMQVMKQRKNGPLIKYKDFANSVKRRMYAEYAQGVSSLVDLACGRGGDISKWRDAGAQNVIAMDLSAAQLEDARNREEGDGKGDAKGDGKGDVKGVSRGGAGAGKSTKIVWIQDSLLNAQLGAKLRPKLPDPTAGADAVAIMFAVQFAFDSREHADALLRTISQLLRPGGVFFGTAPDGDAIRAQLGASNELRLAPPEHPFALLLRMEPKPAPPDGSGGSGGGSGGGGGGGGGGGDGGSGGGESAGSAVEFGQPLIFSLEDTVTNGTDASGCIEFLCHRAALTQLAAAHDLHPIEMCSLADARKAHGYHSGALTEAERQVASPLMTTDDR